MDFNSTSVNNIFTDYKNQKINLLILIILKINSNKIELNKNF